MHLFSFSSRVNPAQPKLWRTISLLLLFSSTQPNPVLVCQTLALCVIWFSSCQFKCILLLTLDFFFSSLAFTFLILSPFTDVCNPSALIFKSHVSCSLKWNQQSEKFNKTIGAQHGCLWKCFFIENRFMHYKKMIR